MTEDTYPVREWEAHVYDFLNAPIPDNVRDHGSRVVADVLCATVAGSADPAIATVGTTASFGNGPSTILGTSEQTNAPQAALVNGAAAIAQEAEEGHNTGGHVGAGIVVGGVAAAEMADTDGVMLVDACVRSYEICVRLERALFAMKDRLNATTPWLLRNPHSTWTTVGPALTAAQVLGASQEELRETFRIAANLAVISMHDPYAEGPPARNFTSGFSAQAGVSAALTARAGLNGSESAIEVVYDPFEDLLPNEEFTASFRRLGNEWEIRHNYFKPYPSCRYTHPPLDALREALTSRDDEVDSADVESVTVRTFENAVEMAHTNPGTPTSAKFSTPYVLARYLVDGKVTLESFSPYALRDDDVGRIADKITLIRDDEYEAAFPERWGAKVEVILEDDCLTGHRSFPRGDYRDPLTDDEFEHRLATLLEWGLGSDEVDTTLETVLDLQNQDVRTVTASLRPEK